MIPWFIGQTCPPPATSKMRYGSGESSGSGSSPKAGGCSRTSPGSLKTKKREQRSEISQAWSPKSTKKTKVQDLRGRNQKRMPNAKAKARVLKAELWINSRIWLFAASAEPNLLAIVAASPCAIPEAA